MGRKAALSRDDWIEAAFKWIAEHGVPSLAVEPLARSLGVTKGGFYWCFANRDELLLAVLERWEAVGTQEIILLVKQVPEPAGQLRALANEVVRRIDIPGTEAAGPVRVHYALVCASSDPLVAPVMARVTAERIGFLTRLLKLAGFPPKLAKQRATLAHACYLGLVLMLATQHGQLDGVKTDELVKSYLAMLLAPAD